MPLPTLRITEIDEFYSRENFEELLKFFRSQTPFLDFKFFELTLEKAGTNLKFKHNLGFLPKDLIQTSLKGQGVLQWNYSLFTNTELCYTLSGTVTEDSPTIVRFLAGTVQG